MAESRSGPVPSRGGRRALGPGLTTFVVVDVILVLTLLALAATALADRSADGSGEPDVQATSPTPEAESTPDQSAPEDPAESEVIEAFVLPSGNIHCSMTEDTATCTILDFSFERPQAPEDCDGTVGNVLRVSAETQELTFPCVEDVPEPADDLPVLEYGQASSVGEMTCQSSRNGAFCRHNPSGAGFSLARAGYTEFAA